MPRVLSTKKLKPGQKELLLNAGISLVEYDAIKIDFPSFEFEYKNVENVIFSSKNAVKAVSEGNIRFENCFCVGSKTAALAEEAGGKILVRADNSLQLAKRILKYHSNKEFHFFCGNKRRNELPELLKKNNIIFQETEVYKISLDPRRFDSEFDGIMFFSPSAVESFTMENSLDTKAFCIGQTTAIEAGKHTKDLVVSNSPGIENVIAKVVSALKN